MIQLIGSLRYKRPHQATWITLAAVVDLSTLQPMALGFYYTIPLGLMLIGHLDMIASLPIYLFVIDFCNRDPELNFM